MTEKYFITSRNCGLGDTLCNVHACFYFAKKYNGSVVIDWRRLPYNNFSKNKINLFHSIFNLPNQIDGIKFYSFEEISECHDLEFSGENYPWIGPGLSQEDAERTILNNKFLNIDSRTAEGCVNHTELQGVTYLLSEYTNFWNKFEIKEQVKNKIQNFKEKYFDSNNVIGIHIRHGNGELRGGYDKPWYSYESTKQKILEILNREYPENIDSKFFFICSDNQKSNDEFINTFPNSFSTQKRYIEDGSGSLHAHNTNAIECIQSAFIDMELLSHCKLGIFTEHSVFNVWPALKMNNVYFFNKDRYYKHQI